MQTTTEQRRALLAASPGALEALQKCLAAAPPISEERVARLADIFGVQPVIVTVQRRQGMAA